jgi:hypothetical protein
MDGRDDSTRCFLLSASLAANGGVFIPGFINLFKAQSPHPHLTFKSFTFCRQCFHMFRMVLTVNGYCFLNSINRLAFVAQMQRVSCEVRTEFVYIIYGWISGFKGLISIT